MPQDIVGLSGKYSYYTAITLALDTHGIDQIVAWLVGARGFEPPTTCTPCKYATRLRYAPKVEIITKAERLGIDEYARKAQDPI